MDMLDHLAEARYPAGVGPGVYDIHSPHVPIRGRDDGDHRAALGGSADRLWVNPDCGLKTRGWAEVAAALEQHGRGGRQVREELVRPDR